jgi:hypothetical protein
MLHNAHVIARRNFLTEHYRLADLEWWNFYKDEIIFEENYFDF